ncbi:MAG TPA: gamma carbonic anhydrase family protein [Myxococcota bacterium]|nr:gamma carbonic anhydrase family protein [Myxococcota bacterium]HOD06992.1 gamma carbonic anhydrase family protein [Myxococcota bacterium]HPB49597.1 gamma carbonic anhydrase family protein [Myxococcota bacterium]HQP94935.1 gamma carbonic anhydrase family protein [Myxococcota bacterium]
MIVKAYKGRTPRIADSAIIMDNVVVAGEVTIGPDANVWFGATIRGDVGGVTIGARTNVQENAVIHESENRTPTLIEPDCTIGHGAIIHGCVIRSGTLIGMGAIVLDDTEIGQECLIGAGCLVPERQRIPEGSLVVGVPGKIVRQLTPEERKAVRASAAHYVEYAREFKD